MPYGVATVPFAVSGLVITGMAGATVRTNVAIPLPAALVAVSCTDEVPAEVACPEMAPVVALSARPAGRPVAAKPVGSWVPVIV